MGIFEKLFGKRNQEITEKETPQIPEAIISESMFSLIYNLSEHPDEIILRIHPKKKNSYDAIIEGNAIVKQNNKNIKIVDIRLVLNDLKSSGLKEVRYSTISKVEINNYIERIDIKGFDENGEPIIYKMKDGTIRIVFSELPRNNNTPFDLDKFSDEFINSLDCKMIHDDREVFHIQNPNEDTVAKIKQFLSNYK